MIATDSMLSPTGFREGESTELRRWGRTLHLSYTANNRITLKCLLAYVFSPLLLGSPTIRYSGGHGICTRAGCYTLNRLATDLLTIRISSKIGTPLRFSVPGVDT